MIDHIPELLEAGIDALKIEGACQIVLLYGSYDECLSPRGRGRIGTPAVGAGLAGGSGEGKPPQLLLWILLWRAGERTVL